MKIIFDLDGTLREVSHRRHFVSGPKKDYDSFFRESVNDPPIEKMVDLFRHMVWSGHDVQVWSGCTIDVWEETKTWFDTHIGDVVSNEDLLPVSSWSLIKNMRPHKNYISDVELKEQWLKESISNGWTPDIVFDDRQSVVDMWRRNGLVCAQVAPGDFDTKKIVHQVRRPMLILMIGPSGAGKSRFVDKITFDYSDVVSSDSVRFQQFNGFKPECYTPEGFNATFTACQNLIETRLRSSLDVIYDATNFRRKNRIDLLKHLDFDSDWFDVEYIIVDRPLDQKLASFDPEYDAHTSEDIIRKHHETFQSSKKHALEGDGYSRIAITDATEGDYNAI